MFAAVGGPSALILALLFVMSLVSLALILRKSVELRHCRGGMAVKGARFERGALGTRVPADRIAAEAHDAMRAGRSRAEAEALAERRGNAALAAMARNLRTLEVIATSAPLLGLLGTVVGMIVSFQSLEETGGGANASVLAGGIWQALLTTAAGLLVAIPAAVAAGLFAARIEAAAQEIEEATGRALDAAR